MKCNKCNNKAVTKVIDQHYCKKHFIQQFEKKVTQAIRNYKLIAKNDKLLLAVSGGKDSIAMLNIVGNYCKKARIKHEVIAINEGVGPYRDQALKRLQKFCKTNDYKLNIFSFQEEFGHKVIDFVSKLKVKPCTVCGILRRYLINKKARELKFTKVAIGHNLDDEAQVILMNQFKGNLMLSSKLGPISGVIKSKKFIPRIKPLYFVTEEETKTYCKLNNLDVKFCACPYQTFAYRKKVMIMLNDFENLYPGTKNGIVNSFLEILPLLKEKYKDAKLDYCKSCGEPAAKDICNVCKLINKIK